MLLVVFCMIIGLSAMERRVSFSDMSQAIKHKKKCTQVKDYSVCSLTGRLMIFVQRSELTQTDLWFLFHLWHERILIDEQWATATTRERIKNFVDHVVKTLDIPSAQINQDEFYRSRLAALEQLEKALEEKSCDGIEWLNQFHNSKQQKIESESTIENERKKRLELRKKDKLIGIFDIPDNKPEATQIPQHTNIYYCTII